MQGENLYSRVHEIGVMPYQELVTFALALCRPMDYLHKQSIFHLDIQPGNLIIKDGQVSIIDFDHSQKQDNNIAYADGYGTKRICSTRTIIQVGHWMPEQISTVWLQLCTMLESEDTQAMTRIKCQRVGENCEKILRILSGARKKNESMHPLSS